MHYANDMKIRQVLADQIRSRMAQKPNLDTQTKLSKAAGVTQSTVWRILECQVGASIDIVESLGKALGVPAIVLLSDPDQVQFMDLWSQLDDHDRAKVLAYMQVTISTRPSNMAAQSTYWTDKQVISTGLAAANTRASARPPIGDEQQHDKTAAASTPRKRSSS